MTMNSYEYKKLISFAAMPASKATTWLVLLLWNVAMEPGTPTPRQLTRLAVSLI